MKVVNLISPKGIKVSLNVSFPFILNRLKVKKLIEAGYFLEAEKDADLVVALKIFG